MQINFEELQKECKSCAIEFIQELSMLPIFLNYFPQVQEKWLEEAGLSISSIQITKAVVSEYLRQKVALEQRIMPQKREDVIKIEDEILKRIFVGKLMKINQEPSAIRKILESLITQQYEGAAVITPEQLAKIEKLTLFEKEGKKFPMNYLVFDPRTMKIIGIEIIRR